MKREALIEAIFSTMQQLHRTSQTSMHTLMGQHEISLTQMELLLAVKHCQPVNVKDLAAHMRLTPGAVTQLLEGLAVRNYIGREPAEYDRRVTMVSLTQTGADKLRSLWEQRKATLRQIMDTLDLEELAVMLRVQEKMLRHFEQQAAAVKQHKTTRRQNDPSTIQA
ncbi:MAG TPA: MarR family winged helix-turn-helix transcriptional regulator [Verrucomicrobiae bacterium]|nr:MarR family winged helix-turn-helix transcriptional regulator [Verrucomicrobiae bacterium]